MHRRNTCSLLVCALSLLLLAFTSPALADSGPAAASAAGAGAAAPPVSYFVLIDAGSTGSRAHVHEYRVDPNRPLPLVEESKKKKIRPGLSSYAPAPPKAAESIQDLLAFIKETVPQSHWSRTPIQVHATAGLRSVTPAEASAVLEVVRDELSRSGFLFERHWARVISGEQEGINGWMAVNYLLGVFDQPAPSSKDGKAVAVPPPPSTGVVEMGGSSMQITFSPSNPSDDDRKQLNEVRVGGHSYFLYTHSFLQYGLQAAEKLYQRLAIAEIEEKGNPCYPPRFRHSSAGDFERCTVSLAGVVDKSIACPAAHCSFNGVYQPRITNEQFLAIENFFYTAKFFGTALEHDAAPAAAVSFSPPTGNQVISGLRAKGKEFCNQDWTALVEVHKETSPDELKAFCFSAAYQTVVLESGLGFSSDTNLRVAKTIRGKGIDWEMGAVLFELMPKDEHRLAREQEERINAKRQFVFDDAEGLRRAVNVDNDPSLTLPLGGLGSRRAAEGGVCTKCLWYTLLVAVAAVVAYFVYRRYAASRKGGMIHSYSQAAFNRV
jgi:apyrase